jgi:hypothetical protein
VATGQQSDKGRATGYSRLQIALVIELLDHPRVLHHASDAE